MCESRDLPSDFVNAVRGINYKSPVTKINVAVDKLPNFTANPNTKEGQVKGGLAQAKLLAWMMGLATNKKIFCMIFVKKIF